MTEGFSDLARNARSLAQEHRREVHQRLGVLTPDQAWFWADSPPARRPKPEPMPQHIPMQSARLDVVSSRPNARPSFSQRIAARRRRNAEAAYAD